MGLWGINIMKLREVPAATSPPEKPAWVIRMFREPALWLALKTGYQPVTPGFLFNPGSNTLLDQLSIIPG